jgi:hypothetical protein
MTYEDNIYNTIRKRSKFIINRGDEWKKEISSAKNFITTPDFKYWTFAKSAGLDNEYHANGGTAKIWLNKIGFINILQLPDSIFKTHIVNSFLSWTKEVNTFDIAGKFKKDQAKNKRFEILVHSSLLPRPLLKETNLHIQNQVFFDEGFKTQVVREVLYRSKRLIKEAKLKYGLKCEVCNFNFGIAYGAHGEGFIEMHHLKPISSGERRTSIEDLRPVCSNCHRMLHKGDRLLSINDA